MIATLRYLKKRLGERTTWVGFVGAVTGAALLPTPYSWLAITMGCIAMLCPEEKKCEH